jgi:hypothetical protein
MFDPPTISEMTIAGPQTTGDSPTTIVSTTMIARMASSQRTPLPAVRRLP